MVALLEEVGEELVSRFNWQSLKRKASWTSTATESQGDVYTLGGADLERILPGTLYNETERTPFVGPVPFEIWQTYTAGLNPSPDNVYTVLGNDLKIWPVPSAGQTFSFYWQSNKWIVDASGSFKDAFDSDEDTPIFDTALMKLGLRMKWKMEKGLPYAEDMRAFESMAMDKSARGMTQPTLHMAGGIRPIAPTIVVPLNSTIPVA